MNTLEQIRELAARRKLEDSLIAKLPILEEQERTQAAINRAKEATETYTARFEASLTEVQARRVELDNELLQIRESLAVYIQKRRSVIALADKTAQLARWLAGAMVREQYPDGSEDWRIEGLGEQLIMDLNNGRKQPMFLTQSLDDVLFNNLIATVANETNEVIVKPTIQPAMPVIEVFQPGR